MDQFGLTFHHLGVVVRELSITRKFLEGTGYRFCVPPVVPNDSLHSVLAVHDQMPIVEAMWQSETPGPLDELVKRGQPGLSWYVCYHTDDLERSLRAMASAGLEPRCVAGANNSALFPLNRISFYSIDGIGLIEIIEGATSDPPGSHVATPSRNMEAFAASVAVTRQAQESGETAIALTGWDYVRMCFPGEALGYTAGAALLKQLDRTREAQAVIATGTVNCPFDEHLAEQHAWIVHGSGQLLEADRCWTAFRQQFPESFGGYYGGGAVMRALGLFDEADALYRSAITHWPAAANLYTDYAAVAQSRGDLVEAAKRWMDVRSRFPDFPDGYLREARSLRDAGSVAKAEAVVEEAARKFPERSDVLIEYAQIAHQRGATQEALKRWDRVISACHGLADGYVGATRVLVDLGRYADAQNVLSPALRMFPKLVAVGELHASIAHQQQDYPEALKRWSDLRSRFPRNIQGYIGGANTLLAASKADEAEILMRDALQLFPHDMNIAMTWANIPSHSQKWDLAIERWISVSQRFPSVPAIQSSYARALMKSGKWDDAERALAEVLARGRVDLLSMRTYAECASERKDWAKAEIRWRDVATRFPESSVGWSGLADMLGRSGRTDEALSTLKSAMQRVSENGDLEQQLARMETLRRDWPSALQLWTKLKRKYPQKPSVLSGIRQALVQAEHDLELVRSEGNPSPFEIPAELANIQDPTDSETGELYRLLMNFESIGDTCEFGIVQRRYGAEPISLLRWASTPPHHLITALKTRFAGVGEPEYTIVRSGEGEYTTRDSRYHMFSHTFTPDTGQGIEKFTAQHLRRMQYLRKKLIGDLTLGEKIFVYKCDQGLSDAQAEGIYRAIRDYGGETALLCVRIANNESLLGTVERMNAGLFIGYIDRFSTVDISVNWWTAICRQVDLQWRSRAEVLADA